MNDLPVATINKARLPNTYNQAKKALDVCARVDECKNWADKAQAMASYARQAHDDTLLKLSNRIKGRALRRAGEILKQFEGRGGDRKTKSKGAHTSDRKSKNDAASKAGMSKHQKDQATRIANIPKDDFEKAIESDDPPTTEKLSAMGKKANAKGESFGKATRLLGTLWRFAEFCEANDPLEVASGVLDHEIAEARSRVNIIDSWLDKFVINIGERK